jgi:hypothetical protein
MPCGRAVPASTARRRPAGCQQFPANDGLDKVCLVRIEPLSVGHSKADPPVQRGQRLLTADVGRCGQLQCVKQLVPDPDNQAIASERRFDLDPRSLTTDGEGMGSSRGNNSGRCAPRAAAVEAYRASHARAGVGCTGVVTRRVEGVGLRTEVMLSPDPANTS